jgi:hypothetical protein
MNPLKKVAGRARGMTVVVEHLPNKKVSVKMQ